jgi:hypothetical protein
VLGHAPQESLDTPSPQPPDDRRWNLVADGVAEESGVAHARRKLFREAIQDFLSSARRVQERNMLFPGQSNHDPKT